MEEEGDEVQRGGGKGGGLRDSVVVIRLEGVYGDVLYLQILWTVYRCVKPAWHKDHCRMAISTSPTIKKTCITGFSSHYKGNTSGWRRRGGRET